MQLASIENLPYPLSRFYIKHVGLWKWEAWVYGWQTREEMLPDFRIGGYRTRARALEAIEAREEYEKEHLGVWRFFVDD